MTKKLRLDIIGYIVLFLLAGVLIFHMRQITNQSTPSFVLDATFIGEYKQGDGEWKVFDENANLSAYDGDLILRGEFNEKTPMYISFYLNHIGVKILVNGKTVFESGETGEVASGMTCGAYWSGWLYEEETLKDEIEIQLHNPHHYGNSDAYKQFFKSLCYGSGMALQERAVGESRPYWVVGLFILVVSIALIGTAIGYFLQRNPSGDLLWSMGFFSLFVSGYILLDTVDLEYKSRMIVLNTCMRQCCIFFSALGLTDCIRKTITGKRKRIVDCMAVISGVVIGILLLLSFADIITVYDSGMYWAPVQAAVSLVLIYLCVKEYGQRTKSIKMLLLSYIIVSGFFLLELVNARVNIWTNGLIIKIVFFLVFIFHLIWAAKLIAVNHSEAAKTKILTEKLRNSRIILSTSQIRSHFIFNILNAVSGMCEYDPKKADETLIRFSRYLRKNIDIMREDVPEPFFKSMSHLEDYIALQQVRFGDKIRFEKELEVTDFKIPPLVLQPIVENAIKHGLLPKKGGGVITIHTKSDEKNISIIIEDDGVGFDMTQIKKEESVGIDNVRFRLENMVNGKIDIRSWPEKGTKVIMTIPYQKRKNN
ncbi:MAG: sensor histidine kinase [Lachnospiraceae bacterium]